MPFQLLRQDITTLSCDVIVNPTDSGYSGSGGTDLAVHRAAGPALEKACRQLPPLSAGEIAVTRGYALPCKHIIHTVGPVWKGGSENEAVLLRSCYRNALRRAKWLRAKTIAFPLISSGAFGFPKDQVLRIAMEAISDFLSVTRVEMEVILCVCDPGSYELREKPALEDYLELRRPRPLFAPFEAACEESCLNVCDSLPLPMPSLEPPMMGAAPASESKAAPANKPLRAKSAARETLADWIHHQDDSFAVKLLKLIDQKQMTDVECYKKANVSKKTFWKINNDPKYKPSKATVLAFAIALELTLPETEQLLKTVGFSLSHSNTFDMIIEFYITRGIYDIFEINAALYQYDQVCLGC